jgi:hypothetical protein
MMTHGSQRFQLLGTALVCLSILAYEILSTRLLSVVLEGHLIIFAIAFAMLGMGAAASFMSLGVWSESSERRTRALSWLAMSLGLSYLLCLAVLTVLSGWSNMVLDQAMDAGGLNTLVDTIRNNTFYRLVSVGAALSMPFFIFGIFIAVLFRSSQGPEYHKLYAADLIGAAVGCILAIVSLNYLGYAGCLGLILISAFVGAAGFSEKRAKLATSANLGLAAMALVLIANPTIVSYFEPQPQINKLSRNYDKDYQVEEKWHVWNAHSRVAYLTMKHKESGETKALYAHEGGEGWALVPGAAPYSLTPLVTALKPKRVLVLFAGVGADMVEVDRQCGGACEITGVEINRHMIDHARSEGFPELNGLTSRPRIDLQVAEAREYLERDKSRYDAILMSWRGAGTSHFVGTSGRLAQYLYTKEAFESLLDHLTPEGVLVIYNGSKAQVLTTFSKIFEDSNWGNLQNRVIIVRGKTSSSSELRGLLGFYDLLENMRLVIKPSGFKDDEVDTITGVADSLDFEVVLSPRGVNPDYRVYQDIANGANIERINQDLKKNHGIELSVTTDNRPFFENLLPRSYYLDATKWLEPRKFSATWNITLIFLYFIVFLSCVSFILIMGPLFVNSGPALSRQNITELFYFLALGAGFILIEIGLVRKLGLILGHPAYSISIVLASLIFSTGVGSLISDRLFGAKLLTAKRTAFLIVTYTILSAFFYDTLKDQIIVLPIVLKGALVVVSLFPLGFLMGQLFPQGLVRVGARDNRLVPWAWAINGTASTISVGIGYLLSFPLGFNILLYIGAAFYAGIILLPLELPNRKPAEVVASHAT